MGIALSEFFFFILFLDLICVFRTSRASSFLLYGQKKQNQRQKIKTWKVA